MSDQLPPDGGWPAPVPPPAGWGPPPPPPPGPSTPVPGAGWGPPPPPPAGWGPPSPPSWGAPPPQGYGPWTPPPVQPGVVPLRPLGLGELFDGAVQTMRQNPKVMFGVSAVLMGVAMLLSTVVLIVAVAGFGVRPASADSTLGRDEVAAAVSEGVLSVGVPQVLTTLATILLTGILILAVSDAVLGRRPTVGEVVQRVRPRIWALVGLSLLTGLIFVVLVLLLSAPAAALLLSSQPLLGGIAAALAVLALLVLAPFLWVRLSFAAPALLLERLSVGRALARSWRLTIGSWWRVFGILFLTQLIAGVATSLLSVPFAVVGAIVGSALGNEATGWLASDALGNLGIVLGSAVTAPFTAAVTALLYIDVRIRREGLDVALARAAEPATPAS
jgi:hypothetical protein